MTVVLIVSRTVAAAVLAAFVLVLAADVRVESEALVDTLFD